MSHWTYRGEEVNELPKGMKAFTYLIKLPNGKWYIGETGQKRWKYYYGSGSELKEYYKSIGVNQGKAEGCKYIIIEFYPTKSDALSAERHLMEITGAIDNDKYLNIQGVSSLGSWGGTFTHTQETKDKISKALKGRKLSSTLIKKLKERGPTVTTPIYTIKDGVRTEYPHVRAFERANGYKRGRGDKWITGKSNGWKTEGFTEIGYL